MIITNVTIENFRCYYGRSSIQFNQEGKITLIYGDSGYGKSSFLQFFRWMFYGDPDFGTQNDKPLFNIHAYKESPINTPTRVFGQIDFEHLGVKYSLTKSVEFSYAINIKNAHIEKTQITLLNLIDDTWVEYSGDIANKINSILPRGLSKYFLLDGEKARDIVLNAKELKVAIYSLFELDTYANALSHLGNKSKKNSVLGYYYNDMASKMTSYSGKFSIADLQENMQDLYEEIEALKEKRHEIMDSIESKNARRDEIFKILGQANNKDSIQLLIKRNKEAIEECEQKIARVKHQIGEMFYKNYPYLFLSKLTSNSSTVLRQKNSELVASNKNVFENLKKELLKEILQKNVCVCGRELDSDSIGKINNIINVMPPDSYAYQFGQFVSKGKRQIQSAQREVIEYDTYITEISKLENRITELEANNDEKFDELKRLNDSKDLVEELEQLKKDLETLGREKSGYEGKIAQKKQIYEISNKQLTAALKTSKISSELSEKINFFEKLKASLEEEKNQKENEVRTTLNSCVRDIFKKLTTQTELDADKIQFVNDDFSLRTTYLTGGQLAVDEYAYVIGIVKALQECKMENNENPIIVDAPFAFTGNTQSEHIFKTLPSVSKQTALLTLDLNKIRNLLSEHELYDFWVIKNNGSQEKAVLERGEINDIEF
jgi:DNA sulfur modification protein DndD